LRPRDSFTLADLGPKVSTGLPRDQTVAADPRLWPPAARRDSAHFISDSIELLVDIDSSGFFSRFAPLGGHVLAVTRVSRDTAMLIDPTSHPWWHTFVRDSSDSQ
jgi:hypothetical protein